MTRRRTPRQFLADLLDGLLSATLWLLAGYVVARIACHFGFGLP